MGSGAGNVSVVIWPVDSIAFLYFLSAMAAIVVALGVA